jgi:hypothetical protein
LEGTGLFPKETLGQLGNGWIADLSKLADFSLEMKLRRLQ